MTDSGFAERVKNKKRRRLVSSIIVAVIVLLALIPLGTRMFKPGGDGPDADVSISIVCTDLSGDIGKLNDRALEEYVPEDGIILPETDVAVVSGETTVLDVLEEVCISNGIQIETENNPAYGSYVKGINYLYEFSAGKYSGWMFSVDGTDSSYSADKVKLDGGERIIWYYVVDFNSEAQ